MGYIYTSIPCLPPGFVSRWQRDDLLTTQRSVCVWHGLPRRWGVAVARCQRLYPLSAALDNRHHHSGTSTSPNRHTHRTASARTVRPSTGHPVEIAAGCSASQPNRTTNAFYAPSSTDDDVYCAAGHVASKARTDRTDLRWTDPHFTASASRPPPSVRLPPIMGTSRATPRSAGT